MGVLPEAIDLGHLDASTLPQTRSATFLNFISAAIAVTKVESDVAGVSARVEATDGDGGHRFRLLVDLSPDLEQGPFAGTIKLHITDSLNPVVSVPVKGLVL